MACICTKAIPREAHNRHNHPKAYILRNHGNLSEVTDDDTLKLLSHIGIVFIDK